MTQQESHFYYITGFKDAHSKEHPDYLFQSFWNKHIDYVELSYLYETFQPYRAGVLAYYRLHHMFEGYDNGSI